MKIQNLQINDTDDGQNSKQSGSEEETEVNEHGETVVKKKSGPWKMLDKKKEEVKPPPGELISAFPFYCSDLSINKDVIRSG